MAAKILSPGLKTILALTAFTTIYFVLSGTYTRAQKPGKMNELVNADDPINKEAVAVLTRYEVKQGYQKKFRKALSKYVKQAIAKEGNIMAEAYYEQDNHSVLWIMERWSSKTELDKNRNGGPFKIVTILSKKKIVQSAKVIPIKDLEPVSKNAWRRVPEKDNDPITIMLFVDSKAGTENKFKELYHKAMPAFRSEPGVINYQLSQFEDDSTQFVTYEKFRSEDAFQFHLNFPPIKPVLDYLNSSIKIQPFQAGLHRLKQFGSLDRQ